MLDENNLSRGTIEVNSLNKKGLTPLDVLLSGDGDSDIEEMLRLAGAVKAENLNSSSHNIVITTQNPSNNQQLTRQNRTRVEKPHQSLSKQLQNYFKYNKLKDAPGKVRDTLLILSVLIATATYQAILSPPGGVWQDNNNDQIISHKAGESIMGSHNPTAYGLFLIFNSIGFFMSIHMIYFLTIDFPLLIELQVSLISLLVTYDTSMTAIAPSSRISTNFTILSIVLPFGIPLGCKILRNNSNRIGFVCKTISSWMNQFIVWRWIIQVLSRVVHILNLA